MSKDKEINFEEKPLSIGSIQDTPQFVWQVDNMKVSVGLPDKIPTNHTSLENKIKNVEVEIAKAEKDIKRKETLEGISENTRSNTQNHELKLLVSNNPAAVRTAAKKELGDLERQLEELRKKVVAGRDWILAHLDKELGRVFTTEWDTQGNDKLQQFFKSYDSVLERLKKVAPIAVMQTFRTKLNQKNSLPPAETLDDALDRVNDVQQLLTESKRFAEIMGMESLKLSDQEAIHTIRCGVHYRQGVEGGLSEGIQDLLDKGAGAEMGWKDFSDPLRMELEKRLVTNNMWQQRDGAPSTAAAFKATVTTIKPSVAAQQQATSSTAGGSVSTEALAKAFAQAFAAAAIEKKGEKRGGKGQDGGGKGGKGGGGASGDADRVCYDFQKKGKCWRGDKCKFQHIKGGADTGGFDRDCRYGRDCRRSKCDFRHPDGRKVDEAESDDSRPGTPIQQPEKKSRK